MRPMEHCQLVGSAQNDSLSLDIWCRLQLHDRNTVNLSEPTFLGVAFVFVELEQRFLVRYLQKRPCQHNAICPGLLEVYGTDACSEHWSRF
jgi:hypothetical protein